jgi:hypothetical protein
MRLCLGASDAKHFSCLCAGGGCLRISLFAELAVSARHSKKDSHMTKKMYWSMEQSLYQMHRQPEWILHKIGPCPCFLQVHVASVGVDPATR